MKSEKEKMVSGETYNPANPRLVLDRARANRICTKYNKKCFNEINMRSRLLKKLINTEGNFWIKPPFYCDYGYNIFIGKKFALKKAVYPKNIHIKREGRNSTLYFL